MTGRRPQTRYVTVGDADVAYQVLGVGPPDLLLFNGLGNSLELAWQVPDYSDLYTRLARFSRLIIFDRRGTGMSDAVPSTAIPTWEDLSEDVGAVLDAVRSTRAAILATAETGPMALLFAAMHPDRVSALAVVSTYARYLVADDYPTGVSPEFLDGVIELVRNEWADFVRPEVMRVVIPSKADDPEFLELSAAMMRSAATPRSAAAQDDYILRHIDVRQALPLVQVPTVVLHSKDHVFMPAAMGRYLADHIDGARFVELPGGDFGYIGDGCATIVEEVAELPTGQRPVDAERILATVLFTDIVESLLDAHDRTVRDHLRQFRGKEVNTTGDGFVASFDGPARAIRCAGSIIEATRALGLEVRAGLHTGECEIRGEDLGGLAVVLALRSDQIERGRWLRPTDSGSRSVGGRHGALSRSLPRGSSQSAWTIRSPRRPRCTNARSPSSPSSRAIRSDVSLDSESHLQTTHRQEHGRTRVGASNGTRSSATPWIRFHNRVVTKAAGSCPRGGASARTSRRVP